MVKTNNLLLAFCAGACIVLSLSMNKAQLEPQLVLVDKLNYSDTIYQNDSMFSILKFENGRLAKIQLKQFIDSRKIKTFGIQTISFYDNGRIHQLKSTCRDTVLTNGSIAYEEQTLILDSLNKINDYQIMSDFKIICKKEFKQ